MNKDIWKVHVNATCCDCGVSFSSHTHGQAQAARHAKTCQHVVRGEVGFAFVYDGTRP